ncbi:MAG: rod-binding protein [Thermoleophilia bacterium]|nr:rod-binding protein [Thermoleophilia bacterium]
MITPVSIAGAAVAAPAPVAAAAGQATGSKTDPKIVEAAKDFEGLFVSMLVSEMFKGTPLTQGNSIYSGMMTQQFGDALADSGGFGLAAMLTKQMEGQA